MVQSTLGMARSERATTGKTKKERATKTRQQRKKRGVTMASKPTKYVYSVQERPNASPFWFRCGAIFENKDGSETLFLNCYPLPDSQGKIRLQLRSADEGTGTGNTGNGNTGNAGNRYQHQTTRHDDSDVGF